MMNDNIQREVITLPPFKRFCMTIGELPSSYVETMTYYEMVLWFTKYLGDTIIPTVNNNAEAVTELQNLFVELQTYVNNYFDNLDVQEEINNKLDVMAEDGTLEEIINQEIFTDINNQLSTINDNLEVLNNEITLLVGDSYGQGVINGVVVENAGWCYHYKQYSHLGNNCLYQCERGAGFATGGSEHGYKFNDLLNLFDLSAEDKLKVKNIVVAGGWNDKDKTKSTIISAIQTFVNNARNKYPNAKIFLSMISNSNDKTSSGSTNRLNLVKNVIPAYKEGITTNGGTYIDKINYILKNYNLFNGSDNTHPNDDGYKLIAQSLFSSVNGGSCNTDSDLLTLNMELPEGYTSSVNNPLFTFAQIVNGELLLFTNGGNGLISFTEPITLTYNNRTIKLTGILNSIPVLRQVSSYNGIEGTAVISTSNNSYRRKCIIKPQNNDLVIEIIMNDNTEQFEATGISIFNQILRCNAEWS